MIRLEYSSKSSSIIGVPCIVQGNRDVRYLTRNPIRATFTPNQFQEAIEEIERILKDDNVIVRLLINDPPSFFSALDLIGQSSPTLRKHVANNITKEDLMSLRSMMKDVVTLVKKDGTRQENIHSSVHSGKIIIADGSVPIEEGDRLTRKLNNGTEESFIVEDRGYYSRHGRIPEHYQAKVRREGSVPNINGSVVYQAVGTNARINIDSDDKSTNVVTVTKDNVFTELKNALGSKIEEESERKQLIAAVVAMEETKDSGEFLAKYQKFMALAANHATALAPFLPSLAEWLS